MDRYTCFLGLIYLYIYLYIYLQKNLLLKNKMAAILNFHVCPAGVLARLVATCSWKVNVDVARQPEELS